MDRVRVGIRLRVATVLCSSLLLPAPGMGDFGLGCCKLAPGVDPHASRTWRGMLVLIAWADGAPATPALAWYSPPTRCRQEQ